MEIALKPADKRLLEEQVAGGRYASTEDAVAAALELLRRQEEAALEEESRLVQHAVDQIDRGEYRTLKNHDEVVAFAEEIRQRSAARRARELGESA